MQNILSGIPEEKKNKYIMLAAGLLLLVVLQAWAIIAGCADKPAAPVGGAPQGMNGGAVTDIDTENPEDAQPEEIDPEKQRIVIVPMLINTKEIMSEDFMPNNVVKLGDKVRGSSELLLNATVREAYLVMQADMEKESFTTPMVISGYRSYARQKQLYDAKVAEYGPNQKVTAVPGTSEHQYSASVDISTDGTCQNNFGELPAGKWIAENSYKYGFIVRYPEDKKELTGINFEPWHLRYVGVEHATAIYEMDVCLEEYVDYLWKTYPNAVKETSPDQFPAPRWAGDMGGNDEMPPSASDID